jgi:hypothetical protein
MGVKKCDGGFPLNLGNLPSESLFRRIGYRDGLGAIRRWRLVDHQLPIDFQITQFNP